MKALFLSNECIICEEAFTVLIIDLIENGIANPKNSHTERKLFTSKKTFQIFTDPFIHSKSWKKVKHSENHMHFFQPKNRAGITYSDEWYPLQMTGMHDDGFDERKDVCKTEIDRGMKCV